MVIVEVTAVLHGLQFALDMGFINAILESDSKLVIQNIQQMSEDYSESRPLTWDAKGTLQRMQWLSKVCERKWTHSGLQMLQQKFWKWLTQIDDSVIHPSLLYYDVDF
ncbi:hypothetical protein Goshw_014825 [Gossypium schwendimanii]|uniref:RNase H type-1 domain-containing protein n=1 Tax=Gossypium schwendimanii TaxID=34291 RepID=A0A7J9MBY9_GOSSC|nr:hypothetical protein [Gossypium schwendimanii]